jgi:hypothetical protein
MMRRSALLTFALFSAVEMGLLAAPGTTSQANAHGMPGSSRAQEPSSGVLATGQKGSSAKPAKQTVEGTLLWGSLESVIQTPDGTMYTFDSKSSVAKRIFAACSVDQVCEVEGMVDGSDIISVSAVRKLRTPTAKGLM